MIQNDFTRTAEAAGERYLAVIAALQGIYRAAAGAPPRGISRAADQAYAIAQSYLDTEHGVIADETRRIASLARAETLHQLGASSDTGELPDALYEQILAGAMHLQAELAVQLERDIATLRQGLRRVALEIAVAARSIGIGEDHARRLRQLRGGDELRFFFTDRSAKRWPSQRFVRTVWRQHLLDTWNETVMATLADHGRVSAEVMHPDPSKHAGAIVSFHPGADLPFYYDIHDEVFHPNSMALLGISKEPG